MIQWDEQLNKQYRNLLLIVANLYIIAPLIYIYLATQFTPPVQEGGHVDMMLYILLIVALVLPALSPIIDRSQIAYYRKIYLAKEEKPAQNGIKSLIDRANYGVDSHTPQGSPMKFFTTLAILKGALVDAVYLFGFVVFFLSGDIIKMLYFYPIGILWTLVHFPRKSQYESLVERLKSHAPVS